MTENEAAELLQHHSGMHGNTTHPKSEKGFLGMLRPFTGTLYEENFHEVMTILKVLSPLLKSPAINREVLSSFWSICHLARAWGIDKEGMLRRNNLLSDAQQEKLSTWIDCISYAVMMLLDQQGDVTAFECYQDYLQ